MTTRDCPRCGAHCNVARSNHGSDGLFRPHRCRGVSAYGAVQPGVPQEGTSATLSPDQFGGGSDVGDAGGDAGGAL